MANGPGRAGAFQAFTVRANGLVNRIMTPVMILPPFDPRTHPAPSGCAANAVWDTGATRSVIRPEVATKLGLQPTGQAVCETAGGTTNNPTHLVNIGLPNRTLVTGVLVSESPNLKGFEALIGMDVIAMGDFAITNAGGRTTMSFRLPSISCIDYVVESNRIMKARVGRNAPCPCGKKKPNGDPVKFKNCCEPKMNTVL